MTTRYLTTDQNGNGSQTYWDINGYFLHGPSGEKLNLGGGNTTVTASNEIVQIGTSYIRIPQGVSNERPATGAAGMIRYLTSENVIEYYNNLTSTWLPISQQPPEITSISPVILSDTSDSQTFTITGSQFASGCFVEFIGQDLTIYGDDQTNFINETSIQAVFNGNNSIYDASFNEPFSVKVSNPSGLNTTLSDAVVYNARPVFTNVINLGSVDSSQNVFGLLANLTGSDPDNHYPLTFDVSNGSTLPGTIDISNTLDGSGVGVFIGNAPIIPFASTTYNPYFVITDASGITSYFERFNFTVRGPLNLRTSTAITSGGTIDISFTDSTGTNYISDPSYGGYTIYTFKASSNTTNAVFTFSPTNWSDIAECLIVGGGGGGGGLIGGGGGAGGMIGGLSNEAFFLFEEGSSYNIQVGGGGTGVAATNPGVAAGLNGSNSYIGSLIAYGGGGGGSYYYPDTSGGPANLKGKGNDGASGGGASSDEFSTNVSKDSFAGASSYTAQGHRGGMSAVSDGCGGGGGGSITEVGVDGTTTSGGRGGNGRESFISGVSSFYSAGGGGGIKAGSGRSGGAGGTGGGGSGSNSTSSAGDNATSHTGSGGGGGANSTSSAGGDGGSGIVIIKIPSYIPHYGENRLVVSGTDLNYDINYLDSSFTPSVNNLPVSNGYTVYIFKAGSGTFTPNFSYDCSYLNVAGGGGGGVSQYFDRGSGGGGAGGFLTGTIPLGSGISHVISVGNGGKGGQYNTWNGSNGGNSVLSGITTIGGGYGAGIAGLPAGGSGGSGGGGRNTGGGGSETSGQGNAGGGSSNSGGGGGGAGTAGSAGSTNGGAGGAGVQYDITGTPTYYAGGGGGGGCGGGNGGSGGSSIGGNGGNQGNFPGGSGKQNTGSGGGGGGGNTTGTTTTYFGGTGGDGGNGVIICRFPTFNSININSIAIGSVSNGTVDIIYVNSSNSVVNSPVSGGYTIYSFTNLINTTSSTFSISYPDSINEYLQYLVIGGGGGGGSGNTSSYGGGGGAGGYLFGYGGITNKSSYGIQVGAGGSAGTTNNAGSNGVDSYFDIFDISGGGGGAGSTTTTQIAKSGSSGGGGSYGALGTTPNVNHIPGNNLVSANGLGQANGYSGARYNITGGGGQGGGGGGVYGRGGKQNATNNDGGSGLTLTVTGSSVTYSRGGDGTPGGTGGTTHTGMGGVGGRNIGGDEPVDGGSGIVILKFPSFVFSTTPNRLNISNINNGMVNVTYVNASNTVVYYPVSGGSTIYSFTPVQFFTPQPNASFTVTPTVGVSCEYLIVGGGGGGGGGHGGGGGAGGLLTNYGSTPVYISSATTVEVGVGGIGGVGYGAGTGSGVSGGNVTGQTGRGVSGGNSRFGIYDVSGGGYGGGYNGNTNGNGGDGGSGGGGAGQIASSGGTVTDVTEGNAGGSTTSGGGAGGGGAGGVGTNSTSASGTNGGASVTSVITGSTVYYAGGGGGGAGVGQTAGTGGTQSGGDGFTGGNDTGKTGGDGVNFTGGGGGGGTGSTNIPPFGGNGGCGIVILRIPSFN